MDFELNTKVDQHTILMLGIVLAIVGSLLILLNKVSRK